MPRKLFRKYLLSHRSITENRWIAWSNPWLGHHNLRQLRWRSVAGGVATRLFAGLVPGLLQTIFAVILSIVFRVNLPVALPTTLCTNPLTIVPLDYLAWRYGVLVTMTDTQQQVPATFSMEGLDWPECIPALLEWMLALGKSLAVGLPLLAVTLAVRRYLVSNIVWRSQVRLAWRRRQRKKIRA